MCWADQYSYARGWNMSSFFRDKERESWVTQKKEHVLGEDTSFLGYDSKKFVQNLEYGASKLLRNVHKYLPTGATSRSGRLKSPTPSVWQSGIKHVATGDCISTLDKDNVGYSFAIHLCCDAPISAYSKHYVRITSRSQPPQPWGKKDEGVFFSFFHILHYGLGHAETSKWTRSTYH